MIFVSHQNGIESDLITGRINALILEDSEEKMNFIYMLEDEVMIDGKHQYISNAIKIYCKSIFDALNENDVSLIKFYEVI